MTNFLAYNMAMIVTNIAEFKNRLSKFIALVEQGEEVEIRKRNIPIARLVPLADRKRNHTQLGCGRGSVKIKSDLTEPMIPGDHWEMLDR